MSALWVLFPHFLLPSMVLAAVLGLVMGSFLNCVAWRVVRGEEWISGRSHCDSCEHELEPRDLIPIVSWISTKGRCRYCNAHISAQNPLTELFTAALYMLLLYHFGPTAEALEMIAFASVLLVLSLTDIDEYIIPNGCIVALLVIRLLYLVYLGFLGADVIALGRTLLISTLVVMLPLCALVWVMDHVLNKPSMGFGDLKLYAVAAFYFGWQRMLFLIIVSCLLGLLFAVIWMRFMQARNASRPEDVSEGGFPFGPAIAAACIITALVGDQVLSWYLSLLL